LIFRQVTKKSLLLETLFLDLVDLVCAALGHPWPSRHWYILYVIEPDGDSHPQRHAEIKKGLPVGNPFLI
jgi:hypothetical protein